MRLNNAFANSIYSNKFLGKTAKQIQVAITEFRLCPELGETKGQDMREIASSAGNPTTAES